MNLQVSKTDTFKLYRAIYAVRPFCPITGNIGNEIHHCLIERGASGLPPYLQAHIDVAWNCVLLSSEGHMRLHGSDPTLNQVCIQSLIDFYGIPYLENQIAAIPFTVPTSLSQVLARNRMMLPEDTKPLESP